MAEIVLTQYSGKIVGPIARLIGYIMNSLYMFLNDVFNVQNIAVCIILFTIIISERNIRIKKTRFLCRK